MRYSKVELARMIDHTLLKPEATPDDIIALCNQAMAFGFAAVCVNPCYAKIACSVLTGSTTATCIVTGFPLGASEPAVKALEAAKAVQTGASEVDVVINVGYLKGGLLDQVREDLEGVVRATRRERQDVVVKVILETCLLSDPEKIMACRMAVDAGANFVKTSTGFGRGGATISDVALLKRVVGPNYGVKASGGIRDLSTAVMMIEAGASRLGTSNSVAILNEMRDIGNKILPGN